MSIEIRVAPAEFPDLDAIERAVVGAVGNIQLDARVRSLELVFDAPEFENSAFWMVDRLADDGFAASLYGSPRDVLTTAPFGSDDRADIDWEAMAHLKDERLDRIKLDRWLHRNLLQLEDLLSGRVNPAGVPSDESSGLQAIWDVWTDGRLRAKQFPGLTQAERRRIFFRVFARHGALLPRHWKTYHQLWEGEYGDQDALLSALALLPSS